MSSSAPFFANALRSLLLTAVVAALLVVCTLVVTHASRWPSPENPPRQGEALDPVAYEQGQYVHSQRALSRRVREPFNTWTNLLFVFGGSMLLLQPASAARRQAGTALIAVGIGSFLYHASASRTLRHLDVGAMYWLYLMLVVLSLAGFWVGFRRFFARTSKLWAVVFPGLSILIAVYRNVRFAGWKPFDLSFVTGVTAMIAVLALFWCALRNGRWLFKLTAVGLFVVAVACQTGDRPGGWFCSPTLLIQAHGMWHVLGAIACWMTCTELAAASENSSDTAPPVTDPPNATLGNGVMPI